MSEIWDSPEPKGDATETIFTRVVEAIVASSLAPIALDDVVGEVSSHLRCNRIMVTPTEIRREVERACLASSWVGVDRAGKLVDRHPERGPLRTSRALQTVTEEAGALSDRLEHRGHSLSVPNVAGLHSTPLLSSKEETALAARIKEGDKSATNALVASNTRLVRHIASRWRLAATASFDEDDLFQQGCIGMARAAEKFDPSRGRFTTYASLWVKQSLARGLANESRTIRVPVHVVERIRKVDRAETELDAEQMYLTVEEWDDLVAEKSGIDVDDLETLRSLRRVPLPLVAACSAPVIGLTTEEEVEKTLLAETVRRSLSHLIESERLVIRERYGLYGGLPQTLEDVGRSLGVTRERVRQIEKAALLKLSNLESLKGMRDVSQVEPKD